MKILNTFVGAMQIRSVETVLVEGFTMQNLSDKYSALFVDNFTVSLEFSTNMTQNPVIIIDCLHGTDSCHYSSFII